MRRKAQTPRWKNFGDYGIAESIGLPKKIENGAIWSVWFGVSGLTFFEADSGYLVREGQCQSPAVAQGHKSILDRVRTIVAAHRRAEELS